MRSKWSRQPGSCKPVLLLHDGLPGSIRMAERLQRELDADVRRFDTFGSSDLASRLAVLACAEPELDPSYRRPRGLFWLSWLRRYAGYGGKLAMVCSAPRDALAGWGPEVDWIESGSVRLFGHDIDAQAARRWIEEPQETGVSNALSGRRLARWVRYDLAALASQPCHAAGNDAWACSSAGRQDLDLVRETMRAWSRPEMAERFELIKRLGESEPDRPEHRAAAGLAIECFERVRRLARSAPERESLEELSRELEKLSGSLEALR